MSPANSAKTSAGDSYSIGSPIRLAMSQTISQSCRASPGMVSAGRPICTRRSVLV